MDGYMNKELVKDCRLIKQVDGVYMDGWIHQDVDAVIKQMAKAWNMTEDEIFNLALREFLTETELRELLDEEAK